SPPRCQPRAGTSGLGEYSAAAPGAVTRYRSSGAPDPTLPSPIQGLVVAPRARVRRARLPASARLTAAEEARLRALRTPAGLPPAGGHPALAGRRAVPPRPNRLAATAGPARADGPLPGGRHLRRRRALGPRLPAPAARPRGGPGHRPCPRRVPDPPPVGRHRQ